VPLADGGDSRAERSTFCWAASGHAVSSCPRTSGSGGAAPAARPSRPPRMSCRPTASATVHRAAFRLEVAVTSTRRASSALSGSAVSGRLTAGGSTSVATLRATLSRCAATFNARDSTRCPRRTVAGASPLSSRRPYRTSRCSGWSRSSRWWPIPGTRCSRTVHR